MRTVLVVVSVLVASPTRGLAAEPASAGRVASVAAPRIQVAFKLDPRLSGPTYGGERWVSPPTFRGANAQDTVDARAAVIDGKGRALRSSPQWTSSDPERVTVSPARGDRVRITARQPGECRVTVVQGEASRSLSVRATRSSGVWQVSISQ